MDFLGPELLAQVGGADDVDEQDGHLPERLFGRGRLSCRKRSDLCAQRRQRGLNDGVSEQGTLSLERGDGDLQLFLFCAHAAREW